MAFDDWFKLSSSDERKKKSDDYQKLIFPLGLAQRDAALAALRPLFGKRKSDSELLYMFIVAKQKYLEADGSITAAEVYLRKRRQYTETEKRYFAALVALDAGVAVLEDYPNFEKVKEAAGEVIN